MREVVAPDTGRMVLFVDSAGQRTAVAEVTRSGAVDRLIRAGLLARSPDRSLSASRAGRLGRLGSA